MERCDCCGGKLVEEKNWLSGDEAGEGTCQGSVDSQGYCRAFSAEEIERQEMANQVQLRVYWDTQDPQNVGWYVEVLGYNARHEAWEHKDDSMKVWFPVDVDAFGKNQEAELLEALQAEFPGAEVI